MSEPKTYEIRAVEDLLSVPLDKLAACLVDLEAWARIMRDIRDLGPEVVRLLDTPGKCGPGRFVWIDDGEHKATIQLHVAVPTESTPAEPAPLHLQREGGEKP